MRGSMKIGIAFCSFMFVGLLLKAGGQTQMLDTAVATSTGATPAPAGFDNQTNGFLTQAAMDATRATFEERDTIADGLGPVYNAQACAECHQNPVTGEFTLQVTSPAGQLNSRQFTFTSLFCPVRHHHTMGRTGYRIFVYT